MSQMVKMGGNFCDSSTIRADMGIRMIPVDSAGQKGPESTSLDVLMVVLGWQQGLVKNCGLGECF